MGLFFENLFIEKWTHLLLRQPAFNIFFMQSLLQISVSFAFEKFDKWYVAYGGRIATFAIILLYIILTINDILYICFQ